MAAYRELPCNQYTGTSSALQKLEGFASRLFHRHSKGTTHDRKAALEDDSLHFSEHTALWDTSSKVFCCCF
jgi:protein kinase A